MQCLELCGFPSTVQRREGYLVTRGVNVSVSVTHNISNGKLIYSSTLHEYNFEVFLPEYFHLLLRYPSTLLHFRGKYFHSTAILTAIVS